MDSVLIRDYVYYSQNNIDVEIVDLNQRARVLGNEIAFHARATVVLINLDSKAGLVSAEKIDHVSGVSPHLIFVMVCGLKSIAHSVLYRYDCYFVPFFIL